MRYLDDLWRLFLFLSIIQVLICFVVLFFGLILFVSFDKDYSDHLKLQSFFVIFDGPHKNSPKLYQIGDDFWII